MNILIAGGSGFIGRHLCYTLLGMNHNLLVFSRNPSRTRQYLPEGISLWEWNGLTCDALEQVLEDTDAVINLAGAPIADARWTSARKDLLRNSRINRTRMLVDAMGRISNDKRPGILINASGIGFYGTHNVQSVSEEFPPGQGFLADLCVDWEKEAVRAEQYDIHVVLLRIGMVLGKDGGALSKMILPFRFFLGGPIGPGTQHVSWIHQEDLSQLIAWILETRPCRGPVNAVAPEIVTMREFCQSLGKALGRPSWFPIPKFLLNIALGELATVMTTGQQVIPLVAQRHGFTFRHPNLEQALQSLFQESSQQP